MTLPATNSEKRKTRLSLISQGFTFIEIMVVIAIFGLVAAISVGTFFPSDLQKMKNASLELSSMIRYAFDEAVVKGQYYRLRFNLDPETQTYTYRLESRDEPFYLSSSPEEEKKTKKKEGEEEAPPEFSEASDEDDIFQEGALPKGIKIQSFFVSYQKDPITSGEVSLYFLPNGWVDPVVLHLSDQEEEDILRLTVNPATARVKIDYGYEAPQFEQN
ncbi:MAG: prepilin-type N-terminal cleavage/methylation domain-containing protein [Deltaproteobacteria bacterium]|nr:prepilin-type N-terminal cleavage/methylation domain-containing protein [Deltaproteobacteria bacterium]